MKIIAHRGASREHRENTLPAFRRAVEIGADSIETDVLKTRDGVLVLHHDETLFKGGKRLPVAGLDYPELIKFDRAIPRLDETLDELGEKIPFCLEIKAAGLAAEVIACVRRYQLEKTVHITSFLVPEIGDVLRLNPSLEVSLTFSALPEHGITDLKRMGIRAASLSHSHFTRETAARLMREGIRMRIYTVNLPDEAAKLKNWGVDAIFTDVPEQMLKFR